jgi:hypothetical protein
MFTHSLILVTCNSDFTDGMGNLYPEEGVICSSKFIFDKSLSTGLYGVLWGQTGSKGIFFKDEPDSIWLLVKVECGQNIIYIDEVYNLVKFERGSVVHVGDKRTCAEYISDYREEHDIPISIDEVTGYISTSCLPNKNALNHGFAGRAISAIAGLHAICTALKSKSVTRSIESHALTLGNYGDAVTLDNCSHAIAIGDHSEARTCGRGSQAIVCGCGSRAISTGVESMVICLGDNCEGSVGFGGCMIMRSGNRIFIAYTGKDIFSNRVYSCTEEGAFVLVH